MHWANKSIVMLRSLRVTFRRLLWKPSHIPTEICQSFRRSGYSDICYLRGSEFGLNEGAVNPARLRAVRLYDDVITMNQVSELIQKTNGENAWLIFYTHDVDKAPSRFGCTPKLLEYTVNVANRSGALVLP